MKRIQQLAEQAGFEKDHFGIGIWNSKEFQEYSRLLVEECANLCYNESIVEGEYFARVLLHHFNVNGVVDQK